MNIAVSIIMPVYNEEIYLRKCVDSVVMQTLYSKELICIDDGSTDNSVCIIREYIVRYPWIKLISQENQGAGTARNLGIQLAQGEFLCFLDADDYYVNNNALEMLYETAVQENISVCAGLRQVDHGTDLLEKDYVLRKMLNGNKVNRLHYVEFQYDFDYQCYLYRKELLIDYNLKFPELRRFQDPPFFVQAMYLANEFAIVDIEFYCYRAGHKNIKYTGKKSCDLIDGMFFNLQFAFKHNLEKLFKITVDRINDAYFDVWYNLLINKSGKIMEKCVDGQKMADKFNLVLEPLAFYDLRKNKERNISLFRKIRSKIRKNARVILYGAGDIGKKCYLYLMQTKYAEIVLWVDLYRSGEEYYGQILSDVGSIVEISDWDQIIITLKTPDVSKGIRQKLIRMGIDEKRIYEWI